MTLSYGNSNQSWINKKKMLVEFLKMKKEKEQNLYKRGINMKLINFVVQLCFLDPIVNFFQSHDFPGRKNSHS